MRVRLLSLAVVVVTACTGGTPGDRSERTSGIDAGAASTRPVTTATTDPDVDGDGDLVVPEGYALVRATVTEADGTVCELCLWLADTADRRRRGLMFVTDLGAGDGMAFVYPDPRSRSFWMKNTVLALSIAFFGVGGTYLGELDMEPCATGPCEFYRTPDDLVVAVEAEQGRLSELGIGPGSVLEVTDLPCEPSAG